MKLKVRVCETDMLGHINNKSYFDYIDESTSYFYKQTNLPLEEPYTFILAKVSCEFIKQGYFGQRLRLTSYPLRCGDKSITLGTEIRNDEDGELIALGESILVYFNLEVQESERIPAYMKEILENYRRDVYD